MDCANIHVAPSVVGGVGVTVGDFYLEFCNHGDADGIEMIAVRMKSFEGRPDSEPLSDPELLDICDDSLAEYKCQSCGLITLTEPDGECSECGAVGVA